MTGHTPIAAADIRKGDQIRFEWDMTQVSGEATAIEYTAATDGQYWSTLGEHYLLARTAAPGTLPLTRTLGWAFSSPVDPVLGVWHTYISHVRFRDDDQPGETYLLQAEREFVASSVVDFLPATAVPKEALDRLMAGHDQVHAGREFCAPDEDNVCRLVAALDAVKDAS
jgi:hypothetical protein